MSQEHPAGALPEGELPVDHPSVGPGDQPLPILRDGGIPASTPNRYWRSFNDPGLPPPGLTTGPSAVLHEAFLSLTKQAQAMARMMQTLVPLIPQIMQLAAPSTGLTQQRSSGEQVGAGEAREQAMDLRGPP